MCADRSSLAHQLPGTGPGRTPAGQALRLETWSLFSPVTDSLWDSGPLFPVAVCSLGLLGPGLVWVQVLCSDMGPAWMGIPVFKSGKTTVLKVRRDRKGWPCAPSPPGTSYMGYGASGRLSGLGKVAHVHQPRASLGSAPQPCHTPSLSPAHCHFHHKAHDARPSQGTLMGPPLPHIKAAHE